MKKTISILLAVLMLLSVFSVLTVSAETEQTAPMNFKPWKALFAHAVSGSNDGDAWVAWQSTHDEKFYVANEKVKNFFLPSSANKAKVEIYNGFSETVKINDTKIGAGQTATVSYEKGRAYFVTAEGVTYDVQFRNSSAEAAIYVNNSDADGNGTDLMSYLNVDKSRSAKATGAIVTPDGKIDNTVIKKIKGRGNTTWGKPKKAYNITYDSKVSIAGMAKGKKYSILANYQDDSLSRNRFLYDLSDAVGMPYASDSRYVDFYVNGYYWGSYQMTEKVEAGSSSLVNDFEEEDYLSEDGQSVKEDFPFIAEVDAGAGSEDYYVSISGGVKVTIKTPELEPGDVGYDEVKQYVKSKFTVFYNAAASRTKDLSEVADVDSLATLYLINEIGKNWDSGVSSTFFTYKPDENGNYKFYGSPVWDYDNSLGNAVGVTYELKDMGVSDYEDYTGWWCQYKGKSAKSRNSSNIMNRLSVNSSVTNAAKTIWNERFIPAINHFAGTAVNAEIERELYTADEYYNLIKDSATMNYLSGWLLNTGSWIADHSSLNLATYDAQKNVYSVNKYATKYANDFEGMYNYCRDWMISRAAWLSKEMAVETPKVDEVDNKDTRTERDKFIQHLVDKYNKGIDPDREPFTAGDFNVDIFKKLSNGMYLVHYTGSKFAYLTAIGKDYIDKYIYYTSGGSAYVYIYDPKTEKEYSLNKAYESGLITKSHLKTISNTINKVDYVARLYENVVVLAAGEKYKDVSRLLDAENAKGKVKSSKPKVAKLVKGKKVTNLVAKKKGTTTLTLKLKSGKQISCKVIVTKHKPKITNMKGKKITSVTVKKGKKVKVKIVGKVKGINNYYGNTDYAKVTSKTTAKTITIKGLKKGTSTLRILVNGKVLSLKVKVKK